MSDVADTVVSLSEHLQELRMCSSENIERLVSNLEPHLEDQLPETFLGSLAEKDQIICYRTVHICWSVTQGKQIPCEMQLKAVLADQHGKNSLVSACTGSGKTLPIALNILLDDPSKNLVTLTLSPLKRLQVTQQNDFNNRYGIPPVVINEDTPRDEAWWNVSADLPMSHIIGYGFSKRLEP